MAQDYVFFLLAGSGEEQIGHHSFISAPSLPRWEGVFRSFAMAPKGWPRGKLSSVVSFLLWIPPLISIKTPLASPSLLTYSHISRTSRVRGMRKPRRGSGVCSNAGSIARHSDVQSLPPANPPLRLPPFPLVRPRAVLGRAQFVHLGHALLELVVLALLVAVSLILSRNTVSFKSK